MDSLPLTKQGVRNLNSMGKKKKPPEAVTGEPEAANADPAPASAPVKDTSDADAVPAG